MQVKVLLCICTASIISNCHTPGRCFIFLPDLSCDCLLSGESGKLQWTGNWVTFLDTMLQMIVLGLSGRSLRLPTRIRSVCVDPAVHLEKVCEYADGKQGMNRVSDAAWAAWAAIY